MKTFNADDLDNDNAEKQLWMAVHEHEREEDTVDSCIQAPWPDFSDAYAIFDENGPTQPFCPEKVWEALLTSFPVQQKQMQTVLLAREIGNLVAWNDTSKRDMNNFSKSINVTCQSFSCMQQEFTIDDVFKEVIMATLKSSDTSALRDAYRQTNSSMNWTTTRILPLLTLKQSAHASFAGTKTKIETIPAARLCSVLHVYCHALL